MSEAKVKISATTVLSLVIAMIWVVAAFLLPVAQDESYYYLWSRYLDFGYFDHPPLVALMAYTSQWASACPLVARLGTLAVGLLTLIGTIKLFKKAGLADDSTLCLAVLLSHANLLGLVYGFLTTPDTLLLCAWVWTLHEMVAALRDDPKRWVTAGLVAGLGLLSKYTMVLIGLVALIAAGKKHARSPWPWAGVLAALLVFTPHLIWNADNDWITVKFQLRHGFLLARPQMPGRVLPEPLPPMAGSPESMLAGAFQKIRETADHEEKKPQFYDAALASLNRYAGFYASQLVLWGAMAPVLLLLLWRHRRDWRQTLRQSPLSPDMRRLFVASAAVPLIVFGFISLFSKVEANWSGMYVLGAAVVLLPLAQEKPRAFFRAGLVNAGLFLLLLMHAQTGWLPVRPHRDRVLRETHGYNSLAERLEKLAALGQGPVFGDSFQVVSMVRFYLPTLMVRQWPGITRDSELVRNRAMNDVSIDALKAGGAFWLVTTDELPPRIKGFRAVSLSLLQDCKFGGLREIPHSEARDPAKRCKNPVHEWYLAHYEFTDEPAAKADGIRQQGTRDDGA